MTDRTDFRPHHGGGLDAAKRTHASWSGGWIDLSTGINPWPYPVPEIDLAAWRRLPDREREEAALAAARTYYRVPEDADIVAAPGSQALIQWLPRLRPPGRVAVLGITYGEHAFCWRQAGHDVVHAETIEEAAADADVVVATNPNNPDGKIWPPDALREAAVTLGARGGWLIVDEAFADLEPDCSLAAQSHLPGVVVLRSFGKFFGLAGVRLGFLIAAPAIAGSVAAALGPWAVGGPALDVASRALADRRWIDRTRRRLARAAADLTATLEASGLAFVGGTDLFRLFAHDRALDIYARLLNAGILVRHFPERPHWLRVGLPANARERARLKRVVGAAAGDSR